MDLSTFTNAPKEVTLAGHKYRVSALQLREWGVVQAWIKANVPGPMRAMNSEDLVNLNAEDRRIALESAAIAQRNWPPKPGSAAWFVALDHPGGHEEFLFNALTRHQPEMTRADAASLSDRLTLQDVAPVIMVCLGIEEDDLKGLGTDQEAASPSLTVATNSEPCPSRSRRPSVGRTKRSKR